VAWVSGPAAYPYDGAITGVYGLDVASGVLKAPTLHDLARRIWLETSDNVITGDFAQVPYEGSPRITNLIPGPDVSGQTSPAPGARINLTRR